MTRCVCLHSLSDQHALEEGVHDQVCVCTYCLVSMHWKRAYMTRCASVLIVSIGTRCQRLLMLHVLMLHIWISAA